MYPYEDHHIYCPYPTIRMREIENALPLVWDVGHLIVWLRKDPRVGAREAYRRRLREIRSAINHALEGTDTDPI